MDDATKVDRNALIIGSLLLALLLVAVTIFIRRGKNKTGSTILLVGPSDGGKTAIFSSLAYNHTPPTHTSLQQNAALFRSPSPFHRKPLQIVDIPGHPRIRGQFSDYFQNGGKTKVTGGGVRAVIFVCDAAALTRNSSSVAEHLHLIMHAISNLPPSKTPPSLLVFANKADLLPTPSAAASGTGVKPRSPNKSLAITRTTTILERELEKRRLSSMRSGAAVLGELGDDTGGDGDAMGGLDITDGDAFSFDKWDGGE
ncbi:hypothetical protein FRC18_003430, partial [Serendipita sp. 400]